MISPPVLTNINGAGFGELALSVLPFITTSILSITALSPIEYITEPLSSDVVLRLVIKVLPKILPVIEPILPVLKISEISRDIASRVDVLL